MTRNYQHETWIESIVLDAITHGDAFSSVCAKIKAFPASHRLRGHAMIEAARMWAEENVYGMHLREAVRSEAIRAQQEKP